MQIFMVSFDWDAFNALIEPPATETAEQLAKPIIRSRKDSPCISASRR